MTCVGISESECPAWDAWANRVAEANDPSSLVSEYAACGVWRPHTVLPFSRMSLVAYLRGWSGWEMVERFVQARLLAGGGGTVRAGRPCFTCGTGAPRGPTSLGHELSTCCVWWRHSSQEVVTVWGTL
ncbi:hypothetical protein TGGT1_411650 [Toxoplasma gondii GT1]|uniref:Uncharacterized protein n=1 Tax=Toxoplasma gondii (strain ATCC 50853 / GT1) TaxID=507601 RepID=S7UEY5_TOXGG|nr:hypothetical protein TGGT1_411650 [Toxoplasma gondii GT1]